jgi:flagellar biosynthesis GTPase FlhF
MRIKIFTAPRLHEALARVRQEMGPEALILDRQQSEAADGNVLWHVHAALDDGAQRNAETEPTAAQAQPETLPRQTDATLARLERIVEGLGNRDASGLREALDRADEQEAFDHLRRLGVSASHAFDMAADFAAREPLGQQSMQWGRRINPKQQTVRLLFTGPAGCGKSTLVAKLAAHYSMQGVRVALLSTDTERIGGTDMLRAYAGTLGIEFYALRKAADVAPALARTQSAQLLLTDTEGWSPRRDASLKRQLDVWDALRCNRRFLLLPVNMDEEDGMQQLKHPAITSMTDIAFSRLDEAQKPGKIINWSFASGLPMSYCSFGPEVPEQMGWLNARGLTALLGKHQPERTA